MVRNHDQPATSPWTTMSPAGRSGNSSNGTKELVLRFACPTCQRCLSVPMRSLGLKDACPGCSTTLQIPELDEEVMGLAAVLKAVGGNPRQSTCPVICPECQQSFPVVPDRLAGPFACPRCRAPLRMTVTAQQPRSSFTPPPSQAVSVYGPMPDPPPPPGPPQPPPPPPIPVAPRSSPTSPPPMPESAYPADDEEEAPFPLPEPAYMSPRQATSRGGGTYIPRVARWMGRLIYWGVAIFLFAVSSVWPPAFFMVIVWMLPIVGVNISWALTPIFINRFTCPQCGELHDCVDVWRCACGYHDHTQRHVLSFRCPLCKSWIGHTNCRRCGATILLR